MSKSDLFFEALSRLAKKEKKEFEKTNSTYTPSANASSGKHQ